MNVRDGSVVGTGAEGYRQATACCSARRHPSCSVIPQVCGDPESEHQGPAHFPVDRNVIARSSATRQSTRTGLLVHRDGPGRTLRSWAENRAVWRTDRGPGRTRRFCARSSLRIANAEALFLPFPVAFHRHVIARSSATRQSKRSGPPGVRLVALGVPSASVPTVPLIVPRPISQKRHCEERSDAASYENRTSRQDGLPWAYSQVVGRDPGSPDLVDCRVVE